MGKDKQPVDNVHHLSQCSPRELLRYERVTAEKRSIEETRERIDDNY